MKKTGIFALRNCFTFNHLQPLSASLLLPLPAALLQSLPALRRPGGSGVFTVTYLNYLLDLPIYNPFMMITSLRTAPRQSALLVLLCCMGSSCAPKIQSFTAYPAMMITRADSVRFDWKISGAPVLLFYPEEADDEENPGKLYLNYKLVTHRNNKDAFATIMLTLLPDTAIDYIAIDTRRNGDSIFAIAVKDTAVWGHRFLVDSLSSSIRRPLTVIHSGRTAQLDAEGHMSAAFRDLPNSGPWEIRAPLTAAEKRDSTLIPGQLRVKTKLIYTKQ
jgi:hypothetical protein